jgi:hypothetical protein
MSEISFKYVKLGHTFKPGRDTDGGFNLCWAADGLGCGELVFYARDGKTVCATKHQSPEFVKQAIAFWLGSVNYTT